jgi:hypothetical protein
MVFTARKIRIIAGKTLKIALFDPVDNCTIKNELLNKTIKKLLKNYKKNYLKTINFIFGSK